MLRSCDMGYNTVSLQKRNDKSAGVKCVNVNVDGKKEKQKPKDAM